MFFHDTNKKLNFDHTLGAMEEVNVFEIRYTKAFDEFAPEGAENLNGGCRLQSGKNSDGDTGNA